MKEVHLALFSDEITSVIQIQGNTSASLLNPPPTPYFLSLFWTFFIVVMRALANTTHKYGKCGASRQMKKSDISLYALLLQAMSG